MEQAGFRGIAVSLALKMLTRKDLIDTTIDSDSYRSWTMVGITEKGWEWLEANKDKIALVFPPPPQKQPFKEDDIPF